jgi:Carboxypeptidase regulatory-like domain
VLDLAPDKGLPDILFKLTPAGAIRGRIDDEYGEPVAGVEVEALIPAEKAEPSEDEPPAAGSELVPLGMAVTNDLGEYRVYGLPPGNYYISAIDTGMPELPDPALRRNGFMISSDGDTPKPTHPPVFFPGVLHRDEAETIALHAGEQARADFVLRTAKLGSVTGRALVNGTPVSGAWVQLRPVELASEFASLEYHSTTDSKGQFQITNVVAGPYIAEGTYQASDTATRLSGHQKVEVLDTALVSIELHLRRGVAIKGVIQGGPGLTFEQQFTQRTIVWIQPVDDSDVSFGVGEVQKDGTFQANDLSEGKYSVQVTGLPDGWYVKSIVAGTQNLSDQGLTVAASSLPPLQITVRQGAAQLDGTVTDGSSYVAGATVRLFREGDQSRRINLSPRAQTDQNGKFVVTDLAPGRYTVSAELSPDDARALSFRKTGSASVTLDENQHKSIEVRIKPQDQQ